MAGETLAALRESRRVAKMRMGQGAPEYVVLKSDPEIRMAIVPLTEAEYQQALDAAATLELPDNGYAIELRDRTLQVHTLLHALREIGDPARKVFGSTQEMLDEETGLQPIDVNYIMDEYQRMIDFSSPALDGLSDDQLDDLKKAFVTIDWSALSGKPWWHLKGFFSTLPAGLPLANSPSLTSILSLIGRSDESESTHGASES